MKKLVTIGLIIAIFFAMGCSKSGGSNTPPSNSNPPSTIGPKGGTLTTTDGNATLTVPSGALSNDATIDISKSVSDESIGALQTPYSFSPSGLTFNTPATITLKYDLTALPNGANETNVKMAYELNGQWIPIPESTVDTTNHTVSAPVTHFSDYGYVYADALDTPEGNFSGVVVYSNNHGYPTSPSNQYYNADDPYYLHNNGRSHYENGHLTGEEWQCVEYVARYYWLIYNHEVRLAAGSNNALDFWDTADLRGLQKYWNGATKPQPGDIVVFRKINKDNTLSGHVAIVREVTADKVYIAQQNWYHNAKDANAELNYYNVTNYLETFNHDSSAYKVIGWLRLPFTTPAITTLAYSPDSFQNIIVDSNSVYWTESNYYGLSSTIKKVRINGGMIETLALATNASTIAIDSINVYWVETNGAIKKVSVNGGEVITLASGLNNPGTIIVDSQNVYWVERAYNGAIKKVGINGGEVITLASGLYPHTIAIDSTSIYWMEIHDIWWTDGSINKMSIDGVGNTKIVPYLYPRGPFTILLDSTSVYWIDGYPDVNLKKIGINSGVVEVIVPNINAYSITMDSTNIYWTECLSGSDGVVKKVSVNGGAITILVSNLKWPRSITVDSTSVYWIESGNYYNYIRKMVK